MPAVYCATGAVLGADNKQIEDELKASEKPMKVQGSVPERE